MGVYLNYNTNSDETITIMITKMRSTFGHHYKAMYMILDYNNIANYEFFI